MTFKNLRIVTNNKKFRIQCSYLEDRVSHIDKLDYVKVNIFSKKGIPVYKLFDKEEYEETWYFLNEYGNPIGRGQGIFLSNELYNPIEFNSKQSALNWIKQKYGTEGLNLCIKENWIPV